MHSGYPDLYPCPYVGFRHLNYDFWKGSTRFDVPVNVINAPVRVWPRFDKVRRRLGYGISG